MRIVTKPDGALARQLRIDSVPEAEPGVFDAPVGAIFAGLGFDPDGPGTDAERAIAAIRAAPTPEERQRRKLALFGFVYGNDRERLQFGTVARQVCAAVDFDEAEQRVHALPEKE